MIFKGRGHASRSQQRLAPPCSSWWRARASDHAAAGGANARAPTPPRRRRAGMGVDGRRPLLIRSELHSSCGAQSSAELAGSSAARRESRRERAMRRAGAARGSRRACALALTLGACVWRRAGAQPACKPSQMSTDQACTPMQACTHREAGCGTTAYCDNPNCTVFSVRRSQNCRAADSNGWAPGPVPSRVANRRVCVPVCAQLSARPVRKCLRHWRRMSALASVRQGHGAWEVEAALLHQGAVWNQAVLGAGERQGPDSAALPWQPQPGVHRVVRQVAPHVPGARSLSAGVY